MAKKAYIGVSNKARRVGKIYIGVSNKARKVRKGYIGVAGKARMFFAYGTIKYHSNYVQCTTANLNKAAASNNNYAFVTDGNNVNAFNSKLVCSVASNLSASRNACYGANAAGQYAVFGGDSGNAETSSGTTVDAYNNSGTRTVATAFPERVKYYKAVSNYTYAIFGPGTSVNNDVLGHGIAYNTVKLYNGSLTQSTTTTQAHNYSYGVSSNAYYAIIYSGGYPNPVYDITSHIPYADAIDMSGTVINLPFDDYARKQRVNGVGAKAGNYAVIAGGQQIGEQGSGNFSNVYAYDQSLTMVSAPDLYLHTNVTVSTQVQGASADGDYAVIPTNGSGDDYSGYYEIYDRTLTKYVPWNYKKPETGTSGDTPVAISFRQYAMFVKSGYWSGDYHNVDVLAVE